MSLSQSEKIMLAGFGLVVVANLVGAAMITRELARANKQIDETAGIVNSVGRDLEQVVKRISGYVGVRL
ncbi:hypothetical protein [Deinococcus misasensis]|uniref:hypothetical protein n=1 Tax=Deinococcus misasensis TaxID=392413 RepID=UPI00054E3B3B|nr:hypothetical protein [Deinococcus misasensis]